MDSDGIRQQARTIIQWFLLIKNDQEALVQTRLLCMAIIVCLVAFYGIFSLFVEPKQKALAQKTAQQKTIECQAPNQATLELAPNIQVLIDKKNSLAENIAVLKLKEQLLRENWDILSDSERFSRVILTLTADAPLDIGKSLKRMNEMAPRAQNNFAIHTLTLTGETSFTDLFSYLRYIEARPEVGIIDNLVIETLPAKDKYQNAQVKFSLLLGRISLGAETKS